jgi:hypothetical protein
VVVSLQLVFDRRLWSVLNMIQPGLQQLEDQHARAPDQP